MTPEEIVKEWQLDWFPIEDSEGMLSYDPEVADPHFIDLVKRAQEEQRKKDIAIAQGFMPLWGENHQELDRARNGIAEEIGKRVIE